MTALDTGMAALRSAASTLRSAAGRVSDLFDRFGNSFRYVMPKGLYARALLIIIVPMVILQSVIAFVFMERHWNSVTQRLSAAVVQDIAGLIDVYTTLKADQAPDPAYCTRALRPDGRLPAGRGDAAGRTEAVLLAARLFAVGGDQQARPAAVLDRHRRPLGAGRGPHPPRRRGACACSCAAAPPMRRIREIFLLWMVGTSSVLLIVAILFLRNQIRPILRLADAAESFGKGREVPSFRPRGALEVRRAAQAFIEMKTRIERAMEQRTAMLAGVSHDLRTILTRFKLELALIGDNSPEIEAMKKDVDEMARMLEAYLAFARGDSGETSSPTDMAAFLDDLKAEGERNGHRTNVAFHGPPVVTVRPAAFKRCVDNLVSNAARHARSISITGHRDHRWLTVTVDDDGPGIPVAMREEVFKPFLRLDDARNQNEGGTGLGLAIARDIARSHGGDITLADSPMGGLRATVRVPV